MPKITPIPARVLRRVFEKAGRILKRLSGKKKNGVK
jgi:hypothetical protein